MKTTIKEAKASKLDNTLKPKRILFRFLIALLIAAAVLFPTYWFGIRAYVFRAKVRSLLSLYLDHYKPEADRVAAREELLKYSKRAVPVLVRELEKNEKLTYSGKGAVVELIADVKDARAISGIIRSVIEDKEHIENLRKLKYYGKMMEEANKAEQALQDYEKYGGKVAESLGTIGHPKTLSVIEKQIKGKDDDGNYFRIFEMRVIGQMKSKEHISELIGIMKDTGKDIRLRSEAAKALGQIGDRSATQPLIEALAYTGDVQLAAVIALGNLKDTLAVKPMIQLYYSPPFSFPAGLQRNIIFSLGDIGGRDAVAELIKIYQTSTDNELRESAKEAYDIMTKARSKGKTK